MPVDPVGHAWAKTLDPPVIFREPDGLFTEDGGGHRNPGASGSVNLCVPKTCATWVDASTGSRRLSAVSGTLLAMLA